MKQRTQLLKKIDEIGQMIVRSSTTKVISFIEHVKAEMRNNPQLIDQNCVNDILKQLLSLQLKIQTHKLGISIIINQDKKRQVVNQSQDKDYYQQISQFEQEISDEDSLMGEGLINQQPQSSNKQGNDFKREKQLLKTTSITQEQQMYRPLPKYVLIKHSYTKLDKQNLSYVCKFCQIKVEGPFWKYRQHLQEHDFWDWFKCMDCEKMFPNSKQLGIHIFSHHAETRSGLKQLYNCPATKIQFVSSTDIQTHVSDILQYHFQAPDGYKFE